MIIANIRVQRIRKVIRNYIEIKDEQNHYLVQITTLTLTIQAQRGMQTVAVENYSHLGLMGMIINIITISTLMIKIWNLNTMQTEKYENSIITSMSHIIFIDLKISNWIKQWQATRDSNVHCIALMRLWKCMNNDLKIKKMYKFIKIQSTGIANTRNNTWLNLFINNKS